MCTLWVAPRPEHGCDRQFWRKCQHTWKGGWRTKIPRRCRRSWGTDNARVAAQHCHGSIWLSGAPGGQLRGVSLSPKRRCDCVRADMAARGGTASTSTPGCREKPAMALRQALRLCPTMTWRAWAKGTPAGPLHRPLRSVLTHKRYRQVRAVATALGQEAVERNEAPHVPVLLDKVLGGFEGRDVSVFVDGTLGAGGHARGILTQHPELKTFVGIDQDLTALALAKETLSRDASGTGSSPEVHFCHGNFRDMKRVLTGLGLYGSVSGILLDLGVSSMQFDTGSRGFSFRYDGPLDMRMDQSGGITAAEVVNSWPEHELGRIFREYGEERHWRALAERVVDARTRAEIQTTSQLLSALGMAGPGRRGRGIHPATRVFQALRMAVNDELGALAEVIPAAVDALHPGGRLCVISFHSLEDRLVKRAFLRAAGRGGDEAGGADELWRPTLAAGRALDPRMHGGFAVVEPGEPPGPVAVARVVTKRPLEADADEVTRNPRSRTAKARFLDKL